jgi:hypothetical protein
MYHESFVNDDIFVGLFVTQVHATLDADEAFHIKSAALTLQLTSSFVVGELVHIPTFHPA